jgi:hypothetical protein
LCVIIDGIRSLRVFFFFFEEKFCAVSADRDVLLLTHAIGYQCETVEAYLIHSLS